MCVCWITDGPAISSKESMLKLRHILVPAYRLLCHRYVKLGFSFSTQVTISNVLEPSLYMLHEYKEFVQFRKVHLINDPTENGNAQLRQDQCFLSFSWVFLNVLLGRDSIFITFLWGKTAKTANYLDPWIELLGNINIPCGYTLHYILLYLIVSRWHIWFKTWIWILNSHSFAKLQLWHNSL